MKFFSVIVLFVLFPISSLAGFYGFKPIDIYDPETGLYYKGVNIQVESKSFAGKGPRTLIKNVFIFDPVEDRGKLLFSSGDDQDIAVFLFETEVKDGVVSFHNGSRESIKNNQQITDRKAKDKILIGLRDQDSGAVTLFTSNKLGQNMEKIAFVSRTANFHIDVKNSKLRVVRQTPEGIELNSYDW